jgi:hypothetical protein
MYRTIILALFVITIIFFFLPWISISCQGTTIVDMSGFDMVFGKDISSSIFGSSSIDRVYSEPLTTDILCVAILGIIASIVKWKRAFILRVILGIAGVALLIVLKFKINNQVAEEGRGMIQIKYLAGYWLTLVIFAIIAVLSFFIDNIKLIFKRMSDITSQDSSQPSEKPPNGNTS